MNRIVLWLALPVGLLAAALFFTLLLSVASETGLCGTWLARSFPAAYCG